MATEARLTHADGTEVTAQEACDDFMNTRVLIVQDNTTYEAIRMVWYDNNSSQVDPANVGYAALSYVYPDSTGTAKLKGASAGNKSLIPTQQG